MLKDALQEFPKATGKVVGWKVGATNQRALDFLNLREPLRGPMFSNYVIETYGNDDVPVLKWADLGHSLLAAEVRLDTHTAIESLCFSR